MFRNSPPLSRPRTGRRIVVALAALAALVTGATFAGTPASAQQSWAPADSATIHPGVQTFTNGGQCTANFILTDGADVFIGQSAHCSGTGGATETNGCLAGSAPLGTEVEINGATQPGELAYNSWLTMQAAGEADPDACQFNDFALVRIHPDDHGRVNPSVPAYGGPEGVGGETSFGETVYSYGNSSLRGGVTVLSPKTGTSLGTTANGWNHPVYTATPGIPGDSGSAFLDSEGRAMGVLSTLTLAPLPASNGVTDFGLALDYANDNTAADYQLADGTEAFTPSLVGLVPLG
ncbi:hypothetical protein BH23ACT2_BH23ACT2_23770 [soil metagenome]